MNPDTTGILTTRYDLRPTPLPPDALEVMADVMINASGREEDYPAYGEAALGRASRRASKAETYFKVVTESADAGNARGSRRTPSEAELQALRLYKGGLGLCQVAETLKLSRHIVRRMIRNAALHTAEPEAEFLGLREVYRAEVHRYIYRKPVHCADEPCRKLGHCRYALRGG